MQSRNDKITPIEKVVSVITHGGFRQLSLEVVNNCPSSASYIVVQSEMLINEYGKEYADWVCNTMATAVLLSHYETRDNILNRLEPSIN